MNKAADFFTFTEDRLRAWCAAVLKKCGVGDAYACAVTDALVSSNLRGVDTHGINLLQFYAKRYMNTSHGDIRVTDEMPAACYIDGGANMGPAVSVFAMDKAMAKAGACGIGMAIVENSSHFGATGYYTCHAARKGYIGFACTEGFLVMPPWGGREKFLSNNPFSISFPWREFPIMLDIANSVTARNKIITYAREGWTLPEGWATDNEGVPTTDAKKALEGFLQPIAGYKGAGIAMMVEIVVGTLTRGQYSRGVLPNVETKSHQHISHLFIAIKPDCFMAKEEIDATLERFVSDFRSVKRMKGVDKLLLPGELEWNREQERRAKGIPVSMAIVRELDTFSEEFGVDALLGKSSY